MTTVNNSGSSPPPINPNDPTTDAANAAANQPTTQVMQLLTSLFSGKDVSAGGITKAAGTTTLESMAIDEGETGVGTQSTSSNVLDISSPTNAPANEEAVSEGLSLTAGVNTSSPGMTALGGAVLKNMQDEVKNNPNSPYSGIVAATQGLPKEQLDPFLGGLAMVALSVILANYARENSQIDKTMSNEFVNTQKSLKVISQDLSQNKLDETQDQVDSLMGQAFMSSIGVGMSVGGAMAAFKELNSVDAEGKLAAGAETRAQTYNTLGGAASQIFTGVGSPMVQAYFTGQQGQKEAQDIIFNNVSQLLDKMADKYSQAGSNADSQVGSAWDLLKNLFSANSQAFKSL